MFCLLVSIERKEYPCLQVGSAYVFRKYINPHWKDETLKQMGYISVCLMGPDPASALSAPTNKTLTADPFGNNLHSTGYNLT